MSSSFLTGLFSLTDEQAMWRVQTENDSAAFAHLMRRWEEPIQRLCTRMVGDEHKGEDLTQEAFARVFTKRMDYQHGGKFSTFLWRVALNLCYDELRRRTRRREYPLEPDPDEGEGTVGIDPNPGPAASAVAAETAETVRKAIAALPEQHRVVVVMRHYENLKFREIAEILDIPEGTVKSRMSEAMAQLESTLSRAMRDDSRPLPHRVTQFAVL